MKLTYKQIQWLKSKYPNDVSLRLNKASIVKTCEYCGNLYSPTHHSQKFCTKKCYREHRKDYKAKWKRENYVQKPNLGSGYITSEHRNKDFDKEEEIIKRELRRLGVR